MGYKFTLTLNREITEEESSLLREGVCAEAKIASVELPPDGEIVTQLDFDTEAGNLAEAIQSALDAVVAVSDLKVDTLDVPPQPNGLPDEDEGEDVMPARPQLSSAPADAVTSAETAEAAEPEAAADLAAEEDADLAVPAGVGAQ